MKKGWLIGIIVGCVLGIALCAGLIALFVGSIFTLTRPVVDAADEFLALLGQERFVDAYACTSDGYHALQDEESFTAGAKQFDFPAFSSASWNHREIRNQEGRVEGTFVSKNGAFQAGCRSRDPGRGQVEGRRR